MKMASLAAACAFTIYSTNSVSAAGGGDGGSTSTPPQCESGQVYDQTTGKCVQSDAVLDQESLFIAGRKLAYAGRYEEAIGLFSRAPKKNDPRVLNLLGFSHRKIGQTYAALAYYKHSIAIDPDYALVREYYGEALLSLGDIAAASEQLKAIEAICGINCDAHRQLAAAIESYDKNRPMTVVNYSSL